MLPGDAGGKELGALRAFGVQGGGGGDNTGQQCKVVGDGEGERELATGATTTIIFWGNESKLSRRDSFLELWQVVSG